MDLFDLYIFLFLSFPQRWSYGIVLWEIATYGEYQILANFYRVLITVS